MEEVRQAREGAAADAAGRARLVTMLAAGGAARESAEVVRVLDLLAGTGVFRMGGVLVGTQAFRAYGNLLDLLLDDRPDDVRMAWEALALRPTAANAAGTVRAAIRRLPAELQARLQEDLPELKIASV